MGRLPPRTGGELYNFHVQEALRKAGYRVTYLHVSLWRSLTLVYFLPLVGRPLSSFLLGLALGWRGGLFLEDEHFTEGLFFTNLFRRVLKRGPLVILCHHLDGYDRSSWLQRQLRRACLGLADRIVTISQFTRQELLSLGLSAERIVIIPPGYDAQALAAPAPERGKILCVASSCVPRKGLTHLVQAMAGVDPALRLHIAGDVETPHYRKVLAPLVRQLGLTDRVRFEGRVSRAELARLYASAELFVLPSLVEGFGIVLLEAMHSGLPVVACRAAALPELVEHGMTGLLVPPGDARALARALQWLSDHPETGRAMGQAGRRRVLGRFSWAQTGSQFVQAVRPYL